MNEQKWMLHDIIAEADRLVFRFGCGDCSRTGPVRLRMYELEPFERLPEKTEGKVPVWEGDWTPTEEDFLPVNRFQGQKDRLYSKFLLTAENAENPSEIIFGGPCHVTGLDGIAQHEYPYPAAASIKGLQVKMTDDAVALGIRHAALNLNQSNILQPFPDEQSILYRMDGADYYFNGRYMAQFDRRVKELSEKGIVVNLILLNSMKWDGEEIHPGMKTILPHPDYCSEGLISAFNTVTSDGLRYFKAFVEFATERYTRPDQQYGRACGFIIGNEVDSQWVWGNAGEKTCEEYVAEYANTLRTAYYSARKKYSEARVYISLDHFWTMRFQDNKLRTYPSREVLELLNRQAIREGNFDWSVAFHPYPENLFHADFWNDGTALETADAGRITFRNIEILPLFLRKEDMRYHGQMRHIILSEQGFHSEENEDSENLAAAAYCLAYCKIEACGGIDAFILHAHVDNRDEFGLNLGIWRRDTRSEEGNRPLSPKPIYRFMKGMDGLERDSLCREAKEIIGTRIWNRMLNRERNEAEC